MPLIFNDAELRAASRELVLIPVQIDTLNDTIDANTENQQNSLDVDNANKQFYDQTKAIIKNYSDELQNLNGQTRTEYQNSDLVDAAKLAPTSIHYPTSPIWVNLPPKLTSGVQGQPFGSVGSYEIVALPPVLSFIGLLKNGYADGALESTIYNAYVPNTIIKVITATPYTVGQKVVIDQGNVSVYGTVLTTGPAIPVSGSCSLPAYLTQATCEAALPVPGVWTPDPTPWAQEITIAEIAPAYGSIGAGARIRNFHPGFNSNERAEISTPYAPELRDYWRAQLDSRVATWEGHLDPQRTALVANEAVGAEATANTAAIAAIDAAKLNINAYQGAAALRAGDTFINPLETSANTRTTEAAARASAIPAVFGSVSQAGDGSYSGSGHYYRLFQWIDQRATKLAGSLNVYYQQFLNDVVLNGVVDNKQFKFDEYSLIFLATAITEYTTATVFVTVKDATGFAISDAVALHDDDDGFATVNTTIVDIQGLVVELAVAVANFDVNKNFRMVKYL